MVAVEVAIVVVNAVQGGVVAVPLSFGYRGVTEVQHVVAVQVIGNRGVAGHLPAKDERRPAVNDSE